MKRLLLADHREELLATLEVILRHWGYRVIACSRPSSVEDLLRETEPDLLILGTRMAANPRFAPALSEAVQVRKRPLILLAEPDVPVPADLPHESLDVPVDLFALFRLIQPHLEKFPRRHMRLEIRLPGLLCAGESCHLAEILSLSSEGLFLRTCFRLEDESRLRVVLPLVGMKQELELEGRVLYRIEPTAGNHYLQGIGIEFSGLTDETRRQLRAFLESRFFGNLSDRPEGQHLGGDEVVLRLGD